jgi:hypothetical protein
MADIKGNAKKRNAKKRNPDNFENTENFALV